MEQAQELLGQFLTTMRPDSIGDIFVYAIFFLALITTFLVPDGNGRATNLMFATLFLCVVDLLIGQRAFLTGGASTEALMAYVAHIGMCLLPLISATSIRTRIKKGKAAMAMPMGVLTFVIGLLYLIASFAQPATLYASTF